jgi:hypothetical protein
MSINRLNISHQLYNWDANTTLVSSNNIEKLLNDDKSHDCHTSPEDIMFENIEKLLSSVKEIYLYELDNKVFGQYPNSFLLYGRLFKELSKQSNKIKNKFADMIDYVSFNSTSKPVTQPAVWTAGCSITAGEGVQADQRYGYLLSEKLNMPEVQLAKNGASIPYSADSILRADVQAGDIVVWGITCAGRVEIANQGRLDPCTIEKYIKQPKQKQYWNLDYFSSETMVLKQIQQIFQVINFCNKIKAKLYIVNILDTAWVSLALSKYKNFLDLSSTKFLDFGTDGAHPGPTQHQLYAEKIFNLIKEDHHG